MKTIFISIIFSILFVSCNQETSIEGKMIYTIKAFIDANKKSDFKIDSILIVKIDTVTPKTLKQFEYNSLLNDIEKHSEMIKLQKEIALSDARLYSVIKTEYQKDKALEEKNKLDDLVKEAELMISKSEELSNKINSMDSTTFLNYLIYSKITITNPDMTRESEEVPFEE